jgi:hypothetical protein
MDFVLLLRLVAAVALTASIAVEVGRHVGEPGPLEDQGDELVADPGGASLGPDR